MSFDFFPKLDKQITKDVKKCSDECNTDDLSDTEWNLVWDEDSDCDDIVQNETIQNSPVSRVTSRLILWCHLIITFFVKSFYLTMNSHPVKK